MCNILNSVQWQRICYLGISMLCIIGMLTVQVSGLIKEMDEKERKYKEICEKYEEKIKIMGLENERLLNDNSKLFEENEKLIW